MVSECQLDLLFVSQYRSYIHIVPLCGQSFLCMTSSPIKWNRTLASLLTETEGNRLVCGQFHVEFFNIIIHKLLHLLYHPNWQCNSQVKAFWQLKACASSDIVFATYSSTCSNSHSLSATVYQANT